MDFVNEKLEEFNEYIKFRNVAIIGLGVSNIPLLDYLYEKKAKKQKTSNFVMNGMRI